MSPSLLDVLSSSVIDLSLSCCLPLTHCHCLSLVVFLSLSRCIFSLTLALSLLLLLPHTQLLSSFTLLLSLARAPSPLVVRLSHSSPCLLSHLVSLTLGLLLSICCFSLFFSRPLSLPLVVSLTCCLSSTRCLSLTLVPSLTHSFSLSQSLQSTRVYECCHGAACAPPPRYSLQPSRLVLYALHAGLARGQSTHSLSGPSSTQ